MSDETDSSLIPELGDLVTFLSDAYTSTTGRIVYRDGNLIRIRPYNGSSSAIDFPLDSESGMFIESLGVSEVIIHEKRMYIQFSKQLGTAPGEALEFFDIDGKPVGEPGIVHQVYASDKEDAVKMQDGTVHDFRFVGPQLPIAVIRPRATPEEEVTAENNGAPSANEVELADELSDELYPDVNFDLLPAALVEEVPSEEQTFSDSVQREDMFISLLLDFPVKRQKDPKVMQRIYRTTDVLLALKNSVVTRDDGGAVLPDAPSRSYTATTIQDVLLKQPTGAPIAALVPVAAVKKVLYADTFTVGDYNHVEFRSDIETLVDVARVEQGFSESTQGQNGFATYIRDLLKTIDTYVPSGEEVSDERIRVDQDVLRSEIPPNPVEGFPTVPASVDKRGNPNLLTNEYVGGIDDRYVRLLSASYSRNPNTGTILNVAAADTAATVAHVVLSKSMAKYRSPVRSSVLLWDIQASEQSRSRSLFYSTLMKQWENQQVVHIQLQEQNVTVTDLFHKRLQPALAFMSQDNVETMDSLGMRTLEFTDDILKPFVTSAMAGQTVWKSAFAKLQGRAIESMGLPTVPAIPAVAPNDSGLMTALTDPVMTDAIKSIQEKETSLANYDLVLANDILKRADATLGPYWYALAGMVPPEVKTATEMAYVSEAARFKRNTIVRRDRAKEFTAQPSLNTCTHVKELEKLRGIRDDDSRMLIFDKFLKNYQAGVRGNWVLCGSCGEDLVCKHEVLLLNEFLNPGRGSTLHKALLLDFAGPVFEGAYICKNCGQKIQELEYDTHLEFDDSGRPLIGRNVVEDEEEKEKDETNVAVAIAEEDAPPFKGSDLTLYYNFRTLFERCGMAMDIETYQRVVAAAQDFLNTNVPPKSAYEKRQATLTAAKKPIGPNYESYFANFQIGILGALVLLELQTSSVNVPIPANGCAFRRDGFPLDGIDISTAGNGALNYVVCVLMSITRSDPPWSLTPWAGLTGKPRQSEVEKVVKGTLYSLLCIPAVAGAPIPPPLTTVTDNYRTRLADAATLKTQLATGTSAAALASSSDKLPSSFRPLPRVVLPSTVTEHPIGNMGRFQSDVETGDVSKIGPVVFGRQYELTLQVINEFHKKGVDSGIVIPNNPRSDSVCCFSRLGAVGLRGLGIGSLELAEAKSAEIELHTGAARRVQRRDPARSSTGTHIFVPWSAPITTKVDPSPDASMYYNLFLKHCFRGRNYGLVHEFGPNLECRQCHFKYPEELVYLTGSEISETNGGKREKALEELAKRRKEIALNAFMMDIRGAEINETTFHALEMTIRQKKTIHPPLALTPGSFLELLERLAQFPVLLPEAGADWKSLQTAMTKIQKEGLTGIKRVKALEDMSKRYDVRLATLKATLTLGGGAKVMDSLARITEDSEGNVNVRNIFNIFVTSASQVANKFTNIKPKTKKWFPKISRHHDELLIKIWQKSASVTTTTLSILQRLEDEEQEVVKKALKRFADWYGPWLALWMESMRVNMGFTDEEFVFTLRWSVFSSLLALLTPSSPLFADSPSVATSATAAKFIQGWLVETLTDATASVEKYQLTATQVTEEINARAELEKASFIQKFDKLDRDLRQVELIKKKLKIGDWAVGTVKNLFSYDADFFEFERDQRAAMGLPEFAGDVTGTEGADATSAAERFGFYQFGDQEVGMEDGSNHRAEQDEDV